MYNDLVIDYFSNPRNAGDIEAADGVGQVGNPVCGDVIRISIRVADDRVADVKFKTFGCVAAVAASSMITELAKGRTLREAGTISNDDVAEALGGLPAAKLHCSNFAADALHLALDDYLRKHSRASEAEEVLDADPKGEAFSSR
jgi:nitrogen fixation NifU-like protein